MFQERKAKPHRSDTPIRIVLVLLSRFFNWRDALVIDQRRTLVRSHVRTFTCCGAGSHAQGALWYP